MNSRVAVIEVVWTGFAVIGTTFSVWNMWDARHDYVRERDRTDGIRRLMNMELAKSALIVESVRLVIQILMILVGIAAMLQVEPKPPPRTAYSEAIRFFFIFLVAALAFKSGYCFYSRRKLIRLWNRRGTRR